MARFRHPRSAAMHIIPGSPQRSTLRRNGAIGTTASGGKRLAEGYTGGIYDRQ